MPEKANMRRCETCRWADLLVDETIDEDSPLYTCRRGDFAKDPPATFGEKYDNDRPAGDGTECESCPAYDSRYIEFPIEVTGVDIKDLVFRPTSDTGRPVRLRACADGWDRDKTYIGVYICDAPLEAMYSRNRETGRLTLTTLNNPLIYVPSERRFIRGIECWWDRVPSSDDVADLTDDDIARSPVFQMGRMVFGGDRE